MYSKIAFSNVKKSIRDYTIYFLTLTFGICLFYMFNSVQAQQAVLKLNASQKSMMHLMSVIINGISVFVAIILGFLIVYANQFLMKRRHKEMGNRGRCYKGHRSWRRISEGSRGYGRTIGEDLCGSFLCR